MMIRQASLDDIQLLVKLRMDYLHEDFGDFTNQETIQNQLVLYFQKHLKDETFIAIIAEEEGVVMSVAYLSITEMPPNPSFKTGKVGTILNVLTYPNYRRQGIATKVLNELIAQAKQKKIDTIKLSATKAGEKLYNELGFIASKYPSMSLYL